MAFLIVGRGSSTIGCLSEDGFSRTRNEFPMPTATLELVDLDLRRFLKERIKNINVDKN